MKLSVHKSGGSFDMYERRYSYSEREENRPDSNMVLLLRFLDGQFEYVLDKGLNKSKALGWTGSFMKQGIALYLLYLHEGQCAAYIAALGEVWESMGEVGAKQRLMTSYRDKYSRRSEFREEMRNYGWIDTKRK